MIAIWMFYCSVCGLGLCVAAVLAERTLLAGRGPVRHVWIVAVALSLLVPAAAFRFAPPTAAPTPTVAASDDVSSSVIADSVLGVPTLAAAPAQLPSRGWTWRASSGSLARADEPLAIGWLMLSAALAAYFLGGMVALGRMRRWWRRQVVQGVPVLVSECTGPALVGAVTPAIVVPEWALGMEPRQLALMLRHEQEHRRARDGQLLAVAQLALVAMPWNAALWWQLLRLRVAVELDCDARVLRDADARSYGDLLLEVARPRRGPSLMGATAFAERAEQLERRIRAMARRRGHASRGARAVATCIGVVAISVAWVAPRPAGRPRPAAASDVPPIVAPSVALPAVSRIATGGQVEKRAPLPRLVATTITVPPELRLDVGPQPPDAAQTVETIFHRLFDGIALAPEQEARARGVLMALEQEQLAQDQALVASIMSSAPQRAALQARRDSALRTLVATDADRALLDARLAPPPNGGRRSGGPPPDSLGGGRRGAPGGAGGGAGERGGGGGRGAPLSVLLDATFHRLFDGIPLSADQAAAARATIEKTQRDLQTLLPPPLPARLAMRPAAGVVVMQLGSDSLLIALVSDDADRATLQSRIVVPIQQPPPPNR